MQGQAEGRNARQVEHEMLLLRGERTRPKGLPRVLGSAEKKTVGHEQCANAIGKVRFVDSQHCALTGLYRFEESSTMSSGSLNLRNA